MGLMFYLFVYFYGDSWEGGNCLLVEVFWGNLVRF
jgi:hypothetical protein